MGIVLRRKNNIQRLVCILVTETFLILVAARVTSFYHEQMNFSDILITIFAFINFAMTFLIILQTEFVLKELHIRENTILNAEETLKIIHSERHNFINHLQVICGLIANGNYCAVGEYIKDLINICLFNSKILNISNHTLKAILQNIKNSADSKGIFLNLEIQSRLNNFYMKSADITTVFNNILENALKNVNFKNNNVPKIINIRIGETEKAYCFYISDSGPALNDEMAQKICLEGFSAKKDGKGYELTLVIKTIKKFGGKIYYDQNSKGFQIILPKQEV